MTTKTDLETIEHALRKFKNYFYSFRYGGGAPYLRECIEALAALERIGQDTKLKQGEMKLE
jgi:hypothetical protein